MYVASPVMVVYDQTNGEDSRSDCRTGAISFRFRLQPV